jgi:hypothetical protein
MIEIAHQMSAAFLLVGGLLVWASGPAAADTLKGKVLGGGQPIINSTVSLWATSAGAPQQLGQAAPEPMAVNEIKRCVDVRARHALR